MLQAEKKGSGGWEKTMGLNEALAIHQPLFSSRADQREHPWIPPTPAMSCQVMPCLIDQAREG